MFVLINRKCVYQPSFLKVNAEKAREQEQNEKKKTN